VHPFTQLGVRRRSVSLEMLQNLPVNPIHAKILRNDFN